MKIIRIPGANIVARFSTDNQDPDSIEIQIEKCSAYCREHNIPILDIYADYAVSGMKAHRNELDRLLEDLRCGKGDTVVILDQSRMIRNMPRWFALRQEIAAMGVRVVSVTQPFVGGDLRDPNTFMMESSTAMINHMWVLQTRQKVLYKMHHMARNGQHTGGKPALGYRVQDGRLVIDEAEAETVRRIFREYAAGKSYKAIIDGLNRDGIKTKRGNAFGSNSLHDLLRNEKYIGTLTYGLKVYRPDGSRNTHAPEGADVVRLEDALPAIIDRETFREVQDRMAENKHTQGGRPPETRDYPLRGKVFCGECGSGMHVRTSRVPKGQGKYYYYHCNSKQQHHDDCENKPIRVDKLEELVLQYVRAVVGNPKIMQQTADKIAASLASLNRTGVARMQALIDEEYDLDAQIARIVDAIAAGAFSPALSGRLRELEARKAKTQQKIRDLNRAASVASLPPRRLQELIADIVESVKIDTAAVFSIVTRVEVYRDAVKIFTAFDPDPTGRPVNAEDLASEELLYTPGTPSGVPIVYINAAGLVMTVRR